MEWKWNELCLGQIMFEITVGNPNVYIYPVLVYVEESDAMTGSHC